MDGFLLRYAQLLQSAALQQEPGLAVKAVPDSFLLLYTNLEERRMKI